MPFMMEMDNLKAVAVVRLKHDVCNHYLFAEEDWSVGIFQEGNFVAFQKQPPIVVPTSLVHQPYDVLTRSRILSLVTLFSEGSRPIVLSAPFAQFWTELRHSSTGKAVFDNCFRC